MKFESKLTYVYISQVLKGLDELRKSTNYKTEKKLHIMGAW